MSTYSITCGVYFLKRTDSPVFGERTGCVVLAASEMEARETANTNSGTEGYLWRDSDRVRCDKLADAASPDVEAGVILWSQERL